MIKNFPYKDTLLDDEKELFPTFASKLIEEGILNYFVPQNLEGKMGSIEEMLLMGRLISKNDLTSAIAIGQTFLGSLPVWLSGNEEQKKDLAKVIKNKGLSCLALTEKENGSDLMKTMTKDHEGKLSGEKWCINNATKSTALTVFTLTAENLPNLHFVQKNKSHEGKFTNGEKINTLGIKGADISSIQFDKFSQKNSLIGKEGQGLEIVLKTMQVSRILCASFSLGASDTMLRLAIDFSQKRILYGSPIINLASVQEKLIKSFQKLYLIESFSLIASRLITMHPDSMSVYSALSKFYTTKLADEIIHSSSEIIGARFYIRNSEYGIAQKIVRDHRVVSLFDGNSDVNISIIANQLKRLSQVSKLEIDPKPFFTLKEKAPNFTGKEKLKLTSRGRDIIWETVMFYEFDEKNKLSQEKLINARKFLAEKINSLQELQSSEGIELVHDFAKLTYEANFFLVSYFNKLPELNLDYSFKKFREDKLFSIQNH